MVTLQELQARHSPEKQARIRAFAEELLKTFEANHATYVNARKALEAAEKERRRQKALARKRARAEAAKADNKQTAPVGFRRGCLLLEGRKVERSGDFERAARHRVRDPE